MAAPSLNSTAIPSTMANRGVYVFYPPAVGTVNGEAVPVLAGPQRVEWQFRYMTPTEYAWWTTTLLGGAVSLALTGAELWDHTMTAKTFTSGNVHFPRHNGYRGGLFWGVTVHITDLLPYVVS